MRGIGNGPLAGAKRGCRFTVQGRRMTLSRAARLGSGRTLGSDFPRSALRADQENEGVGEQLFT